MATVRITAATTFLHGPDRYEPGESYDVDRDLAGYFVVNGWATSDEIDVSVLQPQSVTLDIQSGGHDQEADNG